MEFESVECWTVDGLLVFSCWSDIGKTLARLVANHPCWIDFPCPQNTGKI